MGSGWNLEESKIHPERKIRFLETTVKGFQTPQNFRNNLWGHELGGGLLSPPGPKERNPKKPPNFWRFFAFFEESGESNGPEFLKSDEAQKLGVGFNGISLAFGKSFCGGGKAYHQDGFGFQTLAHSGRSGICQDLK